MALSWDTASLLQGSCSCVPHSGRVEVHDEIVDALVGERNGCDEEEYEEGCEIISQDEADSGDDVDRGADVVDDIF
jgi:hypothetical protein